MKKYIITIIVLFAGAKISAQQDAQYGMYMLNGQVVNAAYIGSVDGTQANIHFRKQWAGIDGAPRTLVANGSKSYFNNKLATGVSFVSDEIGVFSRNNFSIAQAYKLEGGTWNTVFALQANIEQFRSGFASVNYTRNGPDDQLFANNLSETNFNFGAGIYAYSDQWWAGLAIPHIMRNEYNDISSVASVEERHFLLSAGSVFNMNDQLTLKPSVLYKQAAGVRPTLDINSTLYFTQTIGLGLGWRNMDAIVVMAEWITLGRLHFAYMYERTTSDLSNYSNGSHEMLLRYHFSNTKVSNISPRLF